MAAMGILSAVIFFSIDRSESFVAEWRENQEILVEHAQRIGANPEIDKEEIEDEFKKTASLYSPQVLILMGDSIVVHTSEWWIPSNKLRSNGSFELVTHNGFWVAERLDEYEVNGMKRKIFTALPIFFEDNNLQAKFWSEQFPLFETTTYQFSESDGWIAVEVDGPVRASLFRILTAIFLFTSLLAFFGYFVAHTLSNFNKMVEKPLRLLVPIIGVLFLRLMLEIPGVVFFAETFQLFQRATPGLLLSSNLGFFLVDVTLFFLLSTLILNFPLRRTICETGAFNRAIISVGSYLATIVLWMGFVRTVGILIHYSEININLEEVFSLDRFSFLALLGILIFLLGTFFISLKGSELVQKVKIPLGNRAMALVTAALLSFPIFLGVDPGVPPFPFYLALFLLVLVMDLFFENRSVVYPWLAIWLLLLSACTAAMLFKFTLDNDVASRLAVGQEFASELELNSGLEPQLYSLVNQRRKRGERTFDYALYKKKERIWASSSIYPIDLDVMGDLEEGVLSRQGSRTEFIILVDDGNESKGYHLIIGKYSADFFKPLSLFSYVFFLLTILTLILSLINSRIPFLPAEWGLQLIRGPSLRRKVQFLIISLTLTSFVVVSLITVYFFNINSQRDTKAFLFDHYSALSEIQTVGGISTNMESTNGLNQFAEDRKIRMAIYDSNGLLKAVFPGFLKNSSGFPSIFPDLPEMDGSDKYLIERDINLDYPKMATLLANFDQFEGESGFILMGQDPVYRHQTAAFTDFLGTLLNVYLFLFLLSGGFAFGLSDGITQPLSRLRDSLNKVKLGRENEPLEWEHEDEIGELIQDYNRIIQEIDQSAKLLAMTEREVAWREMAKQVAHEIKNPLTPMKLSIQHLQIASKRNVDQLPSLIERTTATLIEQIDNLSRIASEFSTFAKMPEARNEKVNLNEVVVSAHDLFRNRDDMDIELKVPIDEVYVFADKTYLIRVLTNLVKNSIQAIPMERRGEIRIKLYREFENAYLKVSDNGTGIPEEMRDKVFKPNFTSKNSGTGLGLAICHNIIEAFHGRIFFESKVDEGTDFYVELPLMRMKGNLEPTQRVTL